MKGEILMARKKKVYESAAELTEDFIKAGWTPKVRFYEVRLKNGSRDGLKTFVMNNGNLFDECGKLLFYNIPTVGQSERKIPPIIPPLTEPYYGDEFEFIQQREEK